MSSKSGGCVVAALTRAGLPISVFPETESSMVFSMLVYSLVEFILKSNGQQKNILVYEIKNRKLYVRLGERVIIAVLAPISFDNEAHMFVENATDLIKKLDDLVVEEGVIDGNIVKEAKNIIEMLVAKSRLPVGKTITAFRKLCGDLYGEIIDKNINGSKFKGYFRIAYFPRLVDENILRSESNEILRKMLEMCNGNYSVNYICQTTGISLAKIYRYIAKLIRNKKMALEVGFELVI
ncbi:MAG: hypothetical protein Q6363_006320 [Candidatus Njordarchaeota archaeon]